MTFLQGYYFLYIIATFAHKIHFADQNDLSTAREVSISCKDGTLVDAVHYVQ